jgi:hypothetical protein
MDVRRSREETKSGKGWLALVSRSVGCTRAVLSMNDAWCGDRWAMDAEKQVNTDPTEAMVQGSD